MCRPPLRRVASGNGPRPAAASSVDGDSNCPSRSVLPPVFALAGLVVFDRAESTLLPVAEPAVDAADLPLGAMYHVVDQVNARELWEAGYTGAGVNVAVIDTGIAPVESLLGEGKVVAAVDFTAETSAPSDAFVDANGHGTFIAGIIAGAEPGADPATAAEHPQWFLGVAPDSGIVSVKVDDGFDGADPADVISGINWVVDHADELDIGVINLSLNSGIGGQYQTDPFAAAVERAWNAGIVVVAAAGNDGVESGGLASPAHDPYVIAVAGADVADDGITVADWSSSGDGVRNPDVAAPGAHLNSLRAPGSDADVNHPEGYVDAETFRGSGSSQASAVTAGVAALIRQAHPDWSPDQVKAAMAASAQPIAGATVERAGSGLIDAAAAAAVVAPAGTQSFAPASFTENIPQSAGISTVWNGTSWVGTSWVGTSWVGTSWVGTSWVGTSLGRYLVGGYVLGRYELGRYLLGGYVLGRYLLGGYELGRYLLGRYLLGGYELGRYLVGGYVLGGYELGRYLVGGYVLGGYELGRYLLGGYVLGRYVLGGYLLGGYLLGGYVLGGYVLGRYVLGLKLSVMSAD